MKFLYNKKNELITCSNFDLSGGVHFDVTCIVRNNKGTGRNHRALGDPGQVIYAMDGDRYHRRPYMPQTFPLGSWHIKAPYPVSPDDPEYKYKGAWIIPTDAFLMVQVWELDEAGGYLRPTDEWVKDWGYALHFSNSRTTLGCGKIVREPDLMRMKIMVENTIQRNEAILLEVI